MANNNLPVVYLNPLAFYPGKVAVLLAEKQAKYKRVDVDILGRQSLQPWFMKLNPNASVPVCVDGGKTMTESADILKHFDQKDGAPLGSGQVDLEQAYQFVDEINAWDGNLYAFAHTAPGLQGVLADVMAYRLRYAEARAKDTPELAEAYAKKVESMKAAAVKNKDPDAIAANQAQLTALLDKAEAKLSAVAATASSKDTVFLCGQAYTLADAVMAPILYRITMLGRHKLEIVPRSQLSDYLRRMRQRPSWSAAFSTADSGLGKLWWVLPTLLRAKVSNLLGR